MQISHYVSLILKIKLKKERVCRKRAARANFVMLIYNIV